VPTVAAPAAAPKPKTSTADLTKSTAAAPVLPADAPLAAATPDKATDTTGDQKAQPADAKTDPDAGLTIKATKEGLGHQAAAQMADKNAAKDATPQTAAQTPAATAAASAPTTFAAKVAGTPSEGGVQGVTATGATDGGSARLTDLQNVTGTQNQNSTTATVRIGTLPGQTQPTQVPAMTIALQIARNLQKGVNRFDIRLDPAEMGRIDVRMEVSRDGAVAAHMTVEKPETLALLQRDAGSLQQALTDSGLQANPDSLSFSLRDQNAGGNAQGSNTGGTGISPLAAAATEETVVSPVYNVNLSATGGVDIRI
jgi:flagellar hook-length control protein FliK